MKPEEQRNALCEACPCIKLDGLGDWYYIKDGKDIDCLNDDPLQDLNAMHEAEGTLPKELWNKYVNALSDLIEAEDQPERDFRWLSSTADQRAEAFLRCIGKWVD